MSVLERNNVKDIIGRIESATPESPIAVFQHVTEKDTGERVSDFDTFFASTIITKQRIKHNPVGLVGVFNNGMNLERVKLFFENYEQQPVWENA